MTYNIREGLEGATFCKIELHYYKDQLVGWKNPCSSLLKFAYWTRHSGKINSTNALDYIYGKACSMKHEFKGLNKMEKLFDEVIKQVVQETPRKRGRGGKY